MLLRPIFVPGLTRYPLAVMLFMPWKNTSKPGKKPGNSSIEQISIVYGAQAVVISVDPRRVYVQDPGDTSHTTIETVFPGPEGERYCWYQCTVKGGREGRDLDVVQLVKTCQVLGAGEILLNCIDKDGTNSGFDLELIRLVKKSVSIPVIASSGAGKAVHFVDVFEADSNRCSSSCRNFSSPGSDYRRSEKGGTGGRN